MHRLAVFLVVAGCYRPKIKGGDFNCANPGDVCPSGFSCIRGSCLSDSIHYDLSPAAFRGSCKLGPLDLSTTFNGASGTVTLDTETGEITAQIDASDGGSANMQTLLPPMQDGWQRLRQPSGGPAVSLWSFDSINLPKNVTLGASTSSKAVLALAACNDLDLFGTIDLSGYGATPGGTGLPGNARLALDEGKNMKGGGGGGADGSGGGGGGHADVGAAGMGAMGGEGGMGYGTSTLIPIYQGAGGGGGGASGGNPGGVGGAGGGAIALFGHQVNIGGKIDVSGDSGSDGANGSGMAGGGGGGSGGSVLIGADTVELRSGHNLIARGGAGGMGKSGGMNGGEGAAGRIYIGASTFTTSPPLTADPPPVTPNMPTPIESFPR